MAKSTGVVVYFHGLESQPGGRKVHFLRNVFGEVYAPPMNYKKNVNLFNDVLKHLEKVEVRAIVGSSIGGMFAYYMGKKLGVPVLAFNPVLARNPTVNSNVDKSGSKSNLTHVVVGKDDDVVDPEKTVEFLKKKGRKYKLHWKDGGHRTGLIDFMKFVKLIS